MTDGLPAWAPALVTATVCSLVGVPIFRRLAVATNFIDRPARGKMHRRPVPYLGGLAIVVGVLAAMLFEPSVGPRVAVLMSAAALLSAVGLLDDDRTVDPRLRFIAEVVAGVAAIAAGIRISVTGVTVIDLALTLLWIVGVTNAMNLMDNMDGLAAGVATVVAGAVFAIAIAGSQPVVATLAAAVAGACLGFLAYNRPPASIFMGDAGSLFLGFLLAILTIGVSPDPFPPVSFMVPLLLIALPVLDTTAVTIGRLRHGRPVSQGGRDHLSHRLVARGLRRRTAVVVIIAAQGLMGLIAVLTGIGLLSPLAAAIDAAVVVAVVVVPTIRAKVYRGPVTGIPRWFRRGGGAVVAALVILAVPALIALAAAQRPARAGAATATRALAAFRAGDSQRTADDFRLAGEQFARAERRLSSPLASLGLVVPGVSSNLAASRTLVSVGQELAAAGLGVAEAASAGDIAVAEGAVPLDRLQALTPKLRQTADALESAQRRAGEVTSAFLVPPLADAIRDLQAQLGKEVGPARRAAESAALIPQMLGGSERRSYFLAFQNNAELRGSGGFIGNWGELVGEGGRLKLERFGRLDDLNEAGTRPRRVAGPSGFLERWKRFNPGQFWQQINVSPDFPTTAQVINEIYPLSGGSPVDGVIAIDPPGLAALLELTGPVSVPAWPVPVTSANVVDITLVEAYERFPQDERVVFLGDLARLVTEAFTKADLGKPTRVLAALSKAARGGHIVAWMAEPAEQEMMTSLGVTGEVPALKGDSLMVVNQNMAGNKVDYYLRRKIRYDLSIDPGPTPARLSGKVTVTLRNEAPSTGLSAQVIGPYNDRFVAGENRTYVSVYTPFSLKSAALDGAPVEMESLPDLDRLAQSTVVSLHSGQERRLEVEVEGRAELTADGWYRLDLLHQTSLVPDEVEIAITVPKGWQVTQAVGVAGTDKNTAAGTMSLERRQVVAVKVERQGWRGILEKLRAS